MTSHGDWRRQLRSAEDLMNRFILLAHGLECTGIWDAVRRVAPRSGDWRTAVDESVAFMGFRSELTFICGLHPWLNRGSGRITVATVIPRVRQVWLTRIRAVFFAPHRGSQPVFGAGDLPSGTPVFDLIALGREAEARSD